MFQDIIIMLCVAVFIYAMGMVMWTTMVAEFGVVTTAIVFGLGVALTFLLPNDIL